MRARIFNTYVGVRRGDRATHARRRRHLVVHIVPVSHVVAGTSASLDMPPQLELELPGWLHEREQAAGRAPRRARASSRFYCGPRPCAGRTCAKPPAAPRPARLLSACSSQVNATRRRQRRSDLDGTETLGPVDERPQRAQLTARRRT